MNILKRLFGMKEDHSYQQPYNQQPYNQSYGSQGQQTPAWQNRQSQVTSHYGVGQPSSQLNDEQALARYRYMLRTAPPESIEQAHAEAFAKLTPEQRTQALRELGNYVPEHERREFAQMHNDPQSLARVATRAEMRQPGTLERAFGGGGYGRGGMGGGMGGMGMGGMMAGTIMGSLVAGFVGSMIADQFFDSVDPGALAEDFAQEAGVDPGMVEEGFADEGGWGDSGDAGGDFGGDDFGGGFDVEV